MTQTRTRMHIYDGVGADCLRVDALALWLNELLPWLEVDIRGNLLESASDDDALAICSMRLLNPMKLVAQRRPLKPEVDYERRLIDGTTHATPGVMYDGNDLQRLAHRLLPRSERGNRDIHLWFTRRMVATWDENDRRYHARACVLGVPSIISTTGLILAPARDRSYYLSRRLGLDPRNADTGDCLAEEDPRTTDVAKGYAMQAVFHLIDGRAFCEEPACRLSNAHWQKEMLAAQLNGEEFCPEHQKLIDTWRTQPPAI